MFVRNPVVIELYIRLMCDASGADLKYPSEIDLHAIEDESSLLPPVEGLVDRGQI